MTRATETGRARRSPAYEPDRGRGRRRGGGGRRWRWLGGAVLVALAALWLGRNLIAERAVTAMLPTVLAAAASAGVTLTDLRLGSVDLRSPTRLEIAGVATGFDVGRPNQAALRSVFEADRVRLELSDPLRGVGRVALDGFSLELVGDDLPRALPFDRFTDGRLDTGPITLLPPRAGIAQVLRGIDELFFANETVGGFRFEGTVVVRVDDVSTKARLFTEPLADGRARLRFDPDDIRRLSEDVGIRLAPDEITLVSEFPLRVPALIGITERARDRAQALGAEDPSFPIDAYRHVYWSHQLTEAFGADFAKRVTDAHETLPNNTADERAMDYHNNAVGRALLTAGVDVRDLAALVRSDARIIRTPAEVAGRADLLR